MSAQIIRQIFLSAVSREFKHAREQLRADLSGPDLPCKVIEQSEFAAGGGTLLDKLDSYVAESTSVVHLVGDAMGAQAKPDEVTAYLRAHPDFLASQPALKTALGDCQGLSYTQWEAYLALHHEVPIYIYVAADEYADRPLGFDLQPGEREGQKLHLARIRAMGKDRSEFATSERLSTLVLRSLSKMLVASGVAADLESAVSLEAFAKTREESALEADPEQRTVLTPVNVEMLLPAHLILGHSVAVEFYLTEPGRTTLENIELELEIGDSRIKARREVLARGQSVRMLPVEQLVLGHVGTPPVTLRLSCERSCLREKFEWSDVANVITAEDLLRTGNHSRRQPRPRRLKLELVSEELRPRRGILDLDLQPVPAGGCKFEMGSPVTERGRKDDETPHAVRFLHSWWMARHPISQAQFLEVMKTNPSRFQGQSDRLPAESMTWSEANEFCERITELERSADKLPLGFCYRLPTEAEWEFACRAGDEMVQTGSSKSSSAARAAVSHAISTFLLDGSRGANRYGLCDMTGNVFHWCLDHYAPYSAELQVDPCHQGLGLRRVIRGGSWHDPQSLRRPSARMQCDSEKRSSRIGFRVVLARV